MGVIKRQGFKQSVVSYLGVAIGAISTIFIYPLDTATYGLVQFLLGTALLISPFMLMGSTSVSIRFFPEFKDKESGHHGFWLFLHSLAGVGILLICTLLFLFNDQIGTFFSDKSDLHQAYAVYIIPLAILVSILQLNANYCANFKRIVIPGIFQVLIKITLPILILLFYWEKISLPFLVAALVLHYFITIVGILAYVWWLGELHWKVDFSFFKKERLKEMGKYAAIGALSGVGGVMAFRIDSFMVPTLIDFQQNGVYSIALFIGNAIAIPSTALLAIAAPLISDSLQRKDFAHIKDVYQRGSTNLLWIGMLLFCLVMLSAEDLFNIMPNSEEMEGGIWVVLFIAIAKVIEMATSTNHQIIGYSKYYYYNLYMILVLSILNITFNLLLIPIYGIAGAAMATMLSLSLYNILKVGFIYWKFKMLPFTKASLHICLLGALTMAIVYGFLYQVDMHPIVAILLKSTLVIAIYFPLAFWLKISPDINEIVVNVWKRVKGGSKK